MDDLFALLAVDAKVDWAQVNRENLDGTRPLPLKAITAARIGVGGNFVGFDFGWKLLTVRELDFCREKPVAYCSGRFPLCDRLGCGEWPEDCYDGRGLSADWATFASPGSGCGVAPPPSFLPPVQAFPSFLASGSRAPRSSLSPVSGVLLYQPVLFLPYREVILCTCPSWCRRLRLLMP